MTDLRLPANTSIEGHDRDRKGPGAASFYAVALAYLFFFLAVTNLGVGTLSYYTTQQRYAARLPFVEDHWVARLLVLIIGSSIIAACFLLVEDDR